MSESNGINFEAGEYETNNGYDGQSGSVKSIGSPTSLTDRKATLFCWSCGHESPIEGDWIANSTTDQYRLECPNCGCVITERPRSGAP